MDINWLALIWTLPAGIAGVVNLRIWWSAVADYRYAESDPDLRLARVLTARDQLMLHSFLLAVPSVMVLIGLTAMFGSGLLARIVITGGLMSIPIMLAVAAVWGRRNWLRILRLIEAERRRREDIA